MDGWFGRRLAVVEFDGGLPRWPAWHAGRKAEAAAVLAAMGIALPAGKSEVHDGRLPIETAEWGSSA
jgi:hypothetical protein